MAGTVIDGNTLAEELSEHVHESSGNSASARARLAILPATSCRRCVRAPRAAARGAWVRANEHHLPDDAELADVLAVVGKLNADRITGILVLGRCRRHLGAARVSRRSTRTRTSRPCIPRTRGCWPGPSTVRAVDAGRAYLLDAYARSTGREPESFYPGSTLVVVGRSDSVGSGRVAGAPAERHGGDVPLAHERPRRVHAASGHPDRGRGGGGPGDR